MLAAPSAPIFLPVRRIRDILSARDENRRNPPAFVMIHASGVTLLSRQFMREDRMLASPQLAEPHPCCLSATNRNLRKLFTQFSVIPLLLFPFPFSNRAIEYKSLIGQFAQAGGHAMFKITVSTTRSATLCLAAACFASAAQADVMGATSLGGIGGAIPATVSDTLLASTRAANLQQSLVTRIGNAGQVTIAPVNATTTVANNVRLWDEVIPPAPSPKPTQAAAPASAQPATLARTSVAVAQIPTTTPALMQTSMKFNTSNTASAGASVARMTPGAR
jgi:hypothetical protein